MLGFPPLGQVPSQHGTSLQELPEAAQLGGAGPGPLPPFSTQLPLFGLPSHLHRRLSLQGPLLAMKEHWKSVGRRVGASVGGTGALVGGGVGGAGALVGEGVIGANVGSLVGSLVGCGEMGEG